MKCQILFSRENKKNISKCRLLKILLGMQSFKYIFQVGPSAVKAFHLFLQRLQIAIFAENHAQNLKEIMLKLVYSLTAERYVFTCSIATLSN